MAKGRKRNRRRLALYACATLILLLLIYGLAGSLLLPRLLRPVIERKASEALHRPVTIRRLRMNPFALWVEIQGLRVGEREGPDDFILADRIYVNAELASIWERAPVLSEISLDRPEVVLVRIGENEFNFSDLLAPSKSEGPSPAFSLNNIRLRDGRIRFLDHVTGARHELSNIRLDLPFISRRVTYKNAFVQPAFSAKMDGRDLAVEGRTKPFADSLETYMDIRLHELPLADFLVYAPVRLNGSVPTASLDADLALSYAQGAHGVSSVRLIGDLAVHDLVVLDEIGAPVLKLPMLAFDGIDIRLPGPSFALRRLLFQEPDVLLTRDPQGRLNVLGLLPASPPAPAESAAGPAPDPSTMPDVSIEEMRVAGARVNFLDETLKRPFRTTVVMADVTVNEFHATGDRAASYAATLFTERNESVTLRGLFSLEPLELTGTFEALNTRPLKYAPYYEDALPFDLSDASLDLHCAYKLALASTSVRISDLSLTLSSLTLRDRRGDFMLELPKVSISGGSCDLAERAVFVQDARIESPSLALFVGGEPPAGAAGESEPVPAPPVESASPPVAPWDVTLHHLGLTGGKAAVTDRSPSAPARFALDQIRIDVENVTTRPKTPAKVSLAFRVAGEGKATVSGPVTLDPLSAELDVALSGTPLRIVQPYLDDASGLLLSGGRLALDGRASFAADGAPAFRFAGSASVAGLSLLEKSAAAPLLQWHALTLEGIAFSGPPSNVRIDAVRLDGPEADLFVLPNGETNIALALRPPEGPAEEKPAAPSEAPASPGMTLAVGKVALADGAIRMTDRSVHPNYSTEITRLALGVSELRWPDPAPVQITLQALFASSAPLKIGGEFAQGPEGLSLSAKSDLEGMDLGPFTPYSAAFIGYPIRKGKLSLNIETTLQGDALEAKNHVLVDQLALGERLEGPDVPKLPVKLALALLTDRHGRIELNIPISGSLSDPEFSVGRIILHVIRNLIEKAATAPFALLAAALGGGEELSFIDFEPGRARLDDVARARLDRLSDALDARPALRLEIAGQVASAEDRNGIIQVRFEERLKEAKLRETGGTTALSEVTVADDEYNRYLTAAYKEAKFPKPRNFIGIAKDLPPEEMKSLIVANIAVTDDDLLQLARRRAEAARDHLLGGGKVTADRLFLVEPSLSEAGAPKAQFSLGD